jgi:hypothetical protein
MAGLPLRYALIMSTSYPVIQLRIEQKIIKTYQNPGSEFNEVFSYTSPLFPIGDLRIHRIFTLKRNAIHQQRRLLHLSQ